MTRGILGFVSLNFLIASIGFFWAAAAVAQGLPSVEAYAGHPGYSYVSISPDGTRVAVSAAEDGGDRLAVLNLTDTNDRKAYQFGRSVITKLDWYDNDTVIVQVLGRFSTIPELSLRTYLAYPTSDRAPAFVEYQPPVGGFESAGGGSFAWSLYEVVDLVPEEEDYFFMTAYVNRQEGMQQFGSSTPNVWGNDLLQVFVDSAQARAYQQGKPETGRWFLDGRGNVVAQAEILPSGAQVIQVPDGRAFRRIAELDGTTDTGGEIMGLSLDGSAIVVRARRDQRRGLYPISLADGSWGEPIYYNDAYDVGGVLYDEKTFRVNGHLTQEGLLTRYNYFDPELAEIQTALEGVFADHEIRILSRSGDGGKTLFQISAPGRPPVIGLFDSASQSVSTFLESYPGLLESAFGDARTVAYTTSDGNQLVGVLTLPAGVPPQNLPLVVLEDTSAAPTFDVLAQFLASRGYAAFRPGIRALRRIGDVSGMGELDDWVHEMQDDYSAGVAQLVSDGTIDPARVCIYGEGDESYTALMGTIVAGDVYKCVIGISPLTDLQRLVNYARFESQANIGAISIDSPLVRNYDGYAADDLQRLSPVARAAEINAPVLLVGFEQGTHGPSMAAALRRENKVAEFVDYDEGYNEPADGRAQNRITAYSEIERFLAEHLGQ